MPCFPADVLNTDRVVCGEATLQVNHDVSTALLAASGSKPVSDSSKALQVDVKGSKLQDFVSSLASEDFRCHRYTTAVHMALLSVLLKQHEDNDSDSDSDIGDDVLGKSVSCDGA